VALLVSGSGWLAGHVAGVIWLQQAAVIASFIGLIWTIFGREIARTLSWPLGFLFFMLPVGTSLEPWLQDLTAWFIRAGLDLSGVAYGYEGYHISVGSAVWEVAPDCGGLRYLLPGLSLAYAFAGLTYRDMTRRIMFLVVCAGALLVANGIRAYGIIVANHIGIAEGADHRLFSYAIYGVTMPLLFWAALQWKQSDALDAPRCIDETYPFNRRKALFFKGPLQKRTSKTIA
jgi:exosortase